jgi:lytic murein transglycosylase
MRRVQPSRAGRRGVFVVAMAIAGALAMPVADAAAESGKDSQKPVVAAPGPVHRKSEAKTPLVPIAKPGSKNVSGALSGKKPATAASAFPVTGSAPAKTPAAAGRNTPAKPPAIPPSGDNAALTTGSLAAGTPKPGSPATVSDESFQVFLRTLWPLAQARGVTPDTFKAAFDGISPDPKIEELTRKQAEFVKPVWSYLDSAASEQRIARGREQGVQWAEALEAAQKTYGVDPAVILGVWGMETNFGSFTGGKDVIRSLATLSAMNYRGTFFRDELVTALVILQQGHVDRAEMRGSWAGAMGQTQFMPSSFMRFAVDADGDGHKNIWTSVPDAMASTANYLQKNGWKPGLPWGFEVTLPEHFDYRRDKADFARWAGAGVRRADGQALPSHGEASLFLPAGARGPVFLVTANFGVIKRYNNSDSYALGVAHLGDRIYGGAPIMAAWPVNERPLDASQRIELQQRLSQLGYDIGTPDGRLGGKTKDALRDFQTRRGFVPDGYPSLAALESLRAAR